MDKNKPPQEDKIKTILFRIPEKDYLVMVSEAAKERRSITNYLLWIHEQFLNIRRPK